ncbi:MAG: hypothetical protein JWL85_615 [Candidatus Saccharibacteria bacterium]|nr:hypothetical protein [Candidatus Saccharibacteria bacterium]
MFKKLISNLPFNPSLIGQVSFYSKRLHSETSVRRSGLIIVVLAMFLHIFAIISPPEATLAESSNDIIRGGFSSREEAVRECRDKRKDFADILAYYRVTCDILAGAQTVTSRSTSHNRQLDSLGRSPKGPKIERTGKVTDEYKVVIDGKTFYMGNQWSFDGGAYSDYKVLKMTNLDGKVIMVMYRCGNIVTIGKYTPPAPPKPVKPTDVCKNVPGTQTKPEQCRPCEAAESNTDTASCMELKKAARNSTKNINDANGTTANGGDTIVYTLSTKNTGKVKADKYVIEEDLNDVLDYADVVDLHGGTQDKNNIVRWPATTINPGATIQKQITVKIKNPIPQTPVSLSDPTRYDLVMTNVYGTAVNIKLPQTPGKTSEVLASTLPQTGPGSSTIVVFSITVIASYFFARTRLMAKEVDVIRNDFSVSGGV